MSSWSLKRQASYVGAILVFLLLVIGTPVYFYFFTTPPTCSDGKKNGDETQIDCGGSCPRFCAQDTLAPIVLWQRTSEVSPGFYNAVAYVENPNHDALLARASYVFKLYDAENILVTEKRGMINLPPNATTAVFETPLQTGTVVPSRITFDITGSDWQKMKAKAPIIQTTDTIYSSADGFPRITSTLTNRSLKMIAPLKVLAVVFDLDGNAMAFSRTIVDSLDKNESTDVVFTWRKLFPSQYSKIEIIPQVEVGQY